ncbi:MAG: M20/M25/M40 family metallo-hydrolase [Alcanivoracaceae bacterium]|nr:M20/M25/M40 family metallo-hydrolase [Alcanivoracaceae bacterium]
MLNKSTNYINLISIFLLAYLAFIPVKPNNIKTDDIIEKNFYIANAYDHVAAMSKAPHYVGANNHSTVKSYIIKQLQRLGLQIKIQKTNISNKHHTYTEVENIIAKIEGTDETGKSLLIMSHYDSMAFSSLGASDAASGVATILEGIRAYLRQNIKPKNDIIILITDAEELGLLGASAFVNKHPWADNVGAVLNFEARGSSGSSYLLMETNHGNHNLLKTFNEANLKFPTSNSLAYSIYKLLPNDTDLTIFRQDKDIVGFNFAFIDNHFNYHTVLDNTQNLSLDSLAHQAHYLMPMLNKLSQMDLNNLKSDQDDVYFQIPFWKTVSYPYDWTFFISIANLLLFLLVITIGLKNKTLNMKSIFSASLPLFKSLIVTALISFTILKFLYWLHPHYAEILQGFTYNGYHYIAFFALLAISISFFFYRKVTETHFTSDIMVIPLLIWILINIIIALSLPGAHFFILISLLGTIALAVNVLVKKPQPSLTLLLLAPVILIFSPFIVQLPVALGLMVLPFSGLLLVLIFSTFITSIQIPQQYHINKWLFIIPLIGLYIFAETQASFNQQRPLPNSLYYYQDQDSGSAYMFTYDINTDKWNKDFFDERLDAKQLSEFKSKHWRWAKIASETENKNIATAQIVNINDRKYSDRRIYQIKITTQRKVNRLILNTNTELNIFKLAVNKEIIFDEKQVKSIKPDLSLVRISAAANDQFIVDIEIDPQQSLDLSLIEMSAGLLSSRYFNIPARPKEFIPKPFVYSDSIITRQRIILP